MRSFPVAMETLLPPTFKFPLLLWLLTPGAPTARKQVFEQDAHAFTRRLNGILAPGPICYVAKIDAFVVGNSELGVDCYKYQVRTSMYGFSFHTTYPTGYTSSHGM